MVVFMVIGISQIGKNTDVSCCCVVNEDVADATQKQLEAHAKKLDLKVLRASPCPAAEALEFLAEEVKMNEEDGE